MRAAPERPPWLQLLATFGGFLVGPAVALRVATAVAPDSRLLQGVAPIAFAAVFAGGVLIWLGLGIAAVLASFVWRVVRGRRPGPAAPRAGERLVPPGYGAFIVVGCVVGGALGLLAGLSTQATLAAAVATWFSLGLAYGLLLWAAAHRGYLPFDPE